MSLKMGQPNPPRKYYTVHTQLHQFQASNITKVLKTLRIAVSNDFPSVRTTLPLPTTGLKLAQNEAIGHVVIATARCSTQSVTQRTTNDNAETQKAGTWRNLSDTWNILNYTQRISKTSWKMVIVKSKRKPIQRFRTYLHDHAFFAQKRKPYSTQCRRRSPNYSRKAVPRQGDM